jgi:hypothetical protein
MPMKKQMLSLTLHRETLLRLDEPALKHRALGGLQSGTTIETSESLCGPTFVETCDSVRVC